ncbi:metal-dependent hydrolase [Aurantiacibacter luteus]|uniref:Membrane-bound metal-dependent hydrolase n=1 Tax=Aurantiacibacter luteus TaxID=1581420 RepID=A0A0G9N2E4_9SPHN|nr:metal-dependent hydrolase [Aurantiacibacter luteus]KLE35698.1 membrane-bound metal-dependent hydrolase [Aurantiacibacter luteus]
MDNLTHSLVGALIGQAGLKRRTGLAIPALIIGANLPDVDAACFFWLHGTEPLAFRRGITHGPPALVLLPLVLAGLLWGWDRWQTARGTRPEARLPVRFDWLYLLALIGCLTHPALDWMNVYGIRLLEPFSSRWFYGDVLFIIDVWLWLGMGIGLWLSLRREKRGGDWRRTARVTLSAVLAYIGFQAFGAWHDENFYSYAPITPTKTISSPRPVWGRDLIFWNAQQFAVETRMQDTLPLTTCDLAAARAADRQVDAFLFWSRAPVLDRLPDGSFMLGDARYYGVERGQFSVPVPSRFCAGR